MINHNHAGYYAAAWLPRSQNNIMTIFTNKIFQWPEYDTTNELNYPKQTINNHNDK